MLEPNIMSGDAKIILTGTVIQFNRNPIEININFPDFPFKWILKFENDIKIHDNSLKATAPNQNTLETTFINFNNPVGVGSTNPLNIGKVGGENLYINYRIYSLSDNTDKTVHYTIYTKAGEL